MNLKALAYQLRRDTIDIICAGKAGHIGGDMSVMEVLVELYFDQMNIDAKNPEDPDRLPRHPRPPEALPDSCWQAAGTSQGSRRQYQRAVS